MHPNASAEEASRAPDAMEPGISRGGGRAAWAVVILLTLGFMLSILDRTVLVLFVEPIKRDLAISDTQFSLLFGFAFTLLYTVAGIPFGWLADRARRKLVAFAAVLGWSLATLTCGLASTFSQLFAARIGVGVGEAGLAPSATSMIADLFEKDQLGRPMAFFTTGGILGVGVALIFGGAIAALVETHGPFHVPLWGDVRGWQAVLVFLGVLGALFSLLFLTIGEPPRKDRAGTPAASFADVLAFLLERIGFFLPYFLAMSFTTMVVVGFNTWIPSLFIRTFHWSPAQIGLTYGLATLVGGVFGALTAGAWVDRLHKRGGHKGYMWTALAGTAAALIPAVAAPLAPTASAAMVLTCVALVFLPIPAAIAPIAFQIVCPNEMRGRFVALYVIFQSVGGWMLGPLLVALFTDRVFGDTQKVGYSLAASAAIGLPLALVLLVWALRATPPPWRPARQPLER